MVRCWRETDLRKEGLSKLTQRANATVASTQSSWGSVWPLEPHRCPQCYQMLLYQSVSEAMGQVLTHFTKKKKTLCLLCKRTEQRQGIPHTHTWA